MKKRIRAVLCMICMVIGMNLLLAGCSELQENFTGYICFPR